jgi:hypothetical protein
MKAAYYIIKNELTGKTISVEKTVEEAHKVAFEQKADTRIIPAYLADINEPSVP